MVTYKFNVIVGEFVYPYLKKLIVWQSLSPANRKEGVTLKTSVVEPFDFSAAPDTTPRSRL